MIEAEWWDYDSDEELAEAVAGDIGFIIESALDARGAALIALPGGNTPGPILEKLAAQKLDWKKVTIIPGDDRLVPMGDPLSNVTALAKIFLPKGARVIPVISEKVTDPEAAGNAANARISDLKWPPDLVWLGMGIDGHTASIFPGPDLDAAIDAPKGRLAVGVRPDPMPKDAPVARVTLTRAAILSARTLIIVLTGKDKKKVLEQALEEGEESAYPIGRVLAESPVPIDIHWSA